MNLEDRIAIVIPARHASTRFPGKPLHPLRAGTGEPKPLLQWTYETACRVPDVDQVLIATDSEEIAQAATRFAASVVMTSPSHRNGTERCAEALEQLDGVPRLLVNVQGDAPLTPPAVVSALIEAAMRRPEVDVHTPALRCSLEQYSRLEADARAGRVGATTVACTDSGRALYFSKQLIPHVPASTLDGATVPVLLHMGIYAYTPAALRAYAAHPEASVEQLEGLEQLRFLNFGAHVGVVAVDPPSWDIWELNNPSDTPIVEAGLAKMMRS